MNYATKSQEPSWLSHLQSHYFLCLISLHGAGMDTTTLARKTKGIIIQVGDLKTKWDALVADITDNVILGIDFLNAHDALIDIKNLCQIQQIDVES